MGKFCKEISLDTLNPKLSKEWDFNKNYPLRPEDVRCGSNKKVGWECKKCGYKWLETIYNRTKGYGCPCCSGRDVCKINCLASVNPKLAKEWDYEKNYPLTPEDVTLHSNKRVGWTCKKEHKYSTTVLNRSYGSDCPYCAGQKVTKENCLATLKPDLAKEWDYKKNGELTPFDVMPCTNKKVWWKCGEGHKYEMRLADRSSGDNCPYCSGKKVCIDNCLTTLNPELAKEWHHTKNGKLNPHDVTRGSNKMAWWECKRCGYVWQAIVNNRNRSTDCPCCSKIELKNGNICDSKQESYYLLQLEKSGIEFKHCVKIGLGRCTCDFYIPITNTYVEVTSYDNRWKHWRIYHKRLIRKKKYVTGVLKANFKFVQMKQLTPRQLQYVRENMV